MRAFRFVLASALALGIQGGLTAPAGAAVIPTASETLRQVQSDLKVHGLELPPIDPVIVADIDRAVDNLNRELKQAEYAAQDFQAAMDSLGKGIPKNLNPQAQPQPDFKLGDETLKRTGDEFRPIVDGPNYHWRSDPLSMFLALKPHPVLNRINNSWFDQPATPLASLFTEREGFSLYGPSTPVYIGESQMCTITASGVDEKGHQVALTAGHCGKVGDQVVNADSWRVGRSGTVVAHGSKGLDYSVIELGSNAKITRSYNGVTAQRLGGQPGHYEMVCKSGVATGTTCGRVWVSDSRTSMSQVCATVGDSGAPVIAGGAVVGLVSGGVVPQYQLSCHTPIQGPFFQPTITTNMDAVLNDLNVRGGVGRGFTLPNA
ncbi:S1 family peptidase [Corynebacterium sp. ES2794-CONJ1]|uniref:S1 family peptidase n=1 Tax=Corynebacterium sp. ES2794-CONJ1 TaxID=2980553 RepID=UPI0021D97DF2|nr:S1 family peptidase [Corynebacterium sp. ES2794-CONJ1]MCU9518737.1 S1 family peptidase [Corynebacterium sp. ES2794-CONJ1]